MHRYEKDYLKQKHTDTPFWGLVVFSIASILFAINTKFYILAFIFPALLFLSKLVKFRVRIPRFLEILVPFSLSLVFLIVFQWGQIFHDFSKANMLGLLINFLAFMLYFMILVTVYKVKKTSELYLAYVSSIIIVVFSSVLSPWRVNIINGVLFCMFAIASIFYFIDIMKLSYYKVESDTPFIKFKSAPLLISIITVLIVSLVVGVVTKNYEGTALQYLMKKMNMVMSPASFSSSSQLGTMEDMLQSKRVVIRILSKGNISVLRGRVYNRYGKGAWTTQSKYEEMTAGDSLPEGINREIIPGNNPIFPLAPPEKLANIPDYSWNLGTYFVSLRRNNLLYLPRGSGFASLKTGFLKKDSLGNVECPGVPVDNYAALSPNSMRKIPTDINENTREDMIVPDEMRGDLKEIAEEVTKGRKSRIGKIFAIEQYLQKNFKYKTGIKLEKRGMDPIMEFLQYKRDAHCEYFASAMVLLLRSIDIPSRYVVGYIAHEKRMPGDYYVAREKDAHAWVIAYIPEKGWMEFDPTPPSSRPGGGIGTTKTDWMDFIQMKAGLLQYYFKSGEYKKLLSEVVTSLKTLINQKYFLSFVILIVIIIGLIVLRKRIFRLFMRISPGKTKSGMIPESENAEQAWLLLDEFDKKIEKMQIKRPLHLTLMEFADFLGDKEIEEEILKNCREFILAYWHIRYEKEKIEESDLKILNEKLLRLGR
ncbi:MAG: hypothetical protein K8T10_08745 [Candidatus Eremiobacteraeota bacterium]|nr:hypothetical protein [Candidatus Eremiobacteraeota bacterium]